jgi:hypothetical protein
MVASTILTKRIPTYVENATPRQNGSSTVLTKRIPTYVENEPPSHKFPKLSHKKKTLQHHHTQASNQRTT